MQKFLRIFFVFSLLLIFVSNVSGVSMCLDHAKHAKSKVIYKKGSKEEKIPTYSQDDECQCALHMDMNNILLPEPLNMDFAIDTTNDNEMPQPKAISYRCLLDFFSSRAPRQHFSRQLNLYCPISLYRFCSLYCYSVDTCVFT